MARPQREYWNEAIREECNSILQTDTFAAMGAVGYRLAINHLDVVTAFLNPHVDDPELYIEIPNG